MTDLRVVLRSGDSRSDHVDFFFLLISFAYYLPLCSPPRLPATQLPFFFTSPQPLKHTLYAYLCMSPKVFSSFKIFGSAPTRE